MTRAIFLLFLGAGAIILLLVPSKMPFEITNDFNLENPVERFKVEDKDPSYGFIKYQDKTKKLLSDIKGSELLEVSCSDSFYRNVQGVYIFDNLRVGQMHFVRIKNEDFLEFMREKEGTFSDGKKILTGRICQLSDKSILLLYSVGVYDLKLADTTNVRKAITYSWDNSSYVDIISKNVIAGKKTIKIAESESNVQCYSIFHLTTNRELFLLCEELGDWQSNFYVKKVNLASGRVEILEECKNRHKEKLETTCN